jgi:hypothetical protein
MRREGAQAHSGPPGYAVVLQPSLRAHRAWDPAFFSWMAFWTDTACRVRASATLYSELSSGFC